MILSGTGHRPQSITTFGADIFRRTQDLAALQRRMRACAAAALNRHQPDSVVSGMAIGWDMALAEAALELGIPLTAAVPFKGQEKRWARGVQHRYNTILGKASQIVIVSGGEYAPQKMQLRNEWMVENSDAVLALWNGKPGGTGNCVRYAERKEKPVINLWGQFVKHSGLVYVA